jgi:hypothetical protein
MTAAAEPGAGSLLAGFRIDLRRSRRHVNVAQISN